MRNQYASAERVTLRHSAEPRKDSAEAIELKSWFNDIYKVGKLGVWGLLIT